MADKITGKETVRITSVIQVGEKIYQPNQLVKNIPAEELSDLVENNRVSIKEEDVEYCKNKLEAKVVDHTAKPVEKPTKKESK